MRVGASSQIRSEVPLLARAPDVTFARTMARSPLFGRLQQLARRARSQRTRTGAEINLSRRELLELGTVAAAAAGVTRLASACASDPATRNPQHADARNTQVAVIGGGLAGLHCAYRLDQAGVQVRVFEASSRIGGRMHSARGMFPDQQVVELGGELIDTNHRFIHALVAELNLELDDRLANAPEGYAADTWLVGDAVVPEATIVAQFSAVAEALAADMEAADNDDEAFATLDETTLSDYIAEKVPAAQYAELHSILNAAYRGEFGLECEQQSALNMIYLIGSDEPDPFRIFGASDERYHVHGGNDAITSALAERIEDHIETDARLVSAEKSAGRYQLRFEREDGSELEESFDRVVFALPFTLLREVELDALELSSDKRTIIDELGYGTNAKIMGAFRTRIWRTEHNASGSLTTDRPAQQTWDSSIGQSGTHGVLTNFVGGAQGIASGEGSADAWLRGALPDLEVAFPGITEQYVPDSAVRMHWPSYRFARGSYACYRPGQWSFWSTEGLREGNAHFCGEHTSPEFQGWMEGAAETGGRVAKEILDDLEIALPAALEAVIDEDAILTASAAHYPRSVQLPFLKRFMRLRAERNQRAITASTAT